VSRLLIVVNIWGVEVGLVCLESIGVKLGGVVIRIGGC